MKDETIKLIADKMFNKYVADIMASDPKNMKLSLPGHGISVELLVIENQQQWCESKMGGCSN